LSRCEQVNQYQIKIDNKVLEVIALQAPVANDLRTIITTSKIAVELQNMSDEIYCFARLISAFFYPNAIDPYSKRLAEVVKICDMLKHILAKLFIAFEHRDSNQVWKLRQSSTECGIKLQDGIKHQLTFMKQHPRLIGKSLDIMQMIKTLERCSDHCRNIREYIIFMFDGIDIRHVASRA
jgi:phosphate transport system protein